MNYIISFWEKYSWDLEPLFSQPELNAMALTAAVVLFFYFNWIVFDWNEKEHLKMDAWYLERKGKMYYINSVIETIQMVAFWLIVYNAIELINTVIGR